MEETELVSVTFSGSASPYHRGDVAGFPQKEAEALVKSGVASYTEQAEADRLAAEKAEADKPGASAGKKKG